MKYVLTNEEMRLADKYAIETLGTPSLTLMEKAGVALAEKTANLADGEALCLCGGGNNGGDGFVCARILKNKGFSVDVVCVAEKYSADCLAKKTEWENCGGKTLSAIPQKDYAVVVDCLYGTGFHGRLQGEDEKLVLQANTLKRRGVKVLSADIPSGVNGKNGKVEGAAICADETLCIGEIKTGVLLGDGIDCAGRILRADIGIVLPKNQYAVLTDEEVARTILPKRKRNSHKGSYGRGAIVAGSEAYTGAAYLSAVACLRSGVGYTTLYTPKDILPHYILKAPEILLRASNEGGRYVFNEEIMKELLPYESIAYGMGMGASKEVFKGLKWLIENYEGKLVVDADGLNSLATYGDSSVFAKKKCEIILTPHIKEFARLSGLPVEEILEDSIRAAREYAKKHGVTVLLKNAVSVITNGEEVFLNSTGTSGQAKGGSGDVLSGVIAGLSASGVTPFRAGILGAYLVGRSAEIAEKLVGDYSMTATDLVNYLPQAFLRVAENTDENGGEK